MLFNVQWQLDFIKKANRLFLSVWYPVFIYVLFAVAGYCDVTSINLIKGFQSSGDNGLIGTSLITRTSLSQK